MPPAKGTQSARAAAWLLVPGVQKQMNRSVILHFLRWSCLLIGWFPTRR